MQDGAYPRLPGSKPPSSTQINGLGFENEAERIAKRARERTREKEKERKKEKERRNVNKPLPTPLSPTGGQMKQMGRTPGRAVLAQYQGERVGEGGGRIQQQSQSQLQQRPPQQQLPQQRPATTTGYPNPDPRQQGLCLAAAVSPPPPQQQQQQQQQQRKYPGPIHSYPHTHTHTQPQPRPMTASAALGQRPVYGVTPAHVPVRYPGAGRSGQYPQVGQGQQGKGQQRQGQQGNFQAYQPPQHQQQGPSKLYPGPFNPVSPVHGHIPSAGSYLFNPTANPLTSPTGFPATGYPVSSVIGLPPDTSGPAIAELPPGGPQVQMAELDSGENGSGFVAELPVEETGVAMRTKKKDEESEKRNSIFGTGGANPWGFFLEDNPAVDPKKEEDDKASQKEEIVFEADSTPLTPVITELPSDVTAANINIDDMTPINESADPLNIPKPLSVRLKANSASSSASPGQSPVFVPFRPGATSTGPASAPSPSLTPSLTPTFTAYSPASRPTALPSPTPALVPLIQLGHHSPIPSPHRPSPGTPPVPFSAPSSHGRSQSQETFVPVNPLDRISVQSAPALPAKIPEERRPSQTQTQTQTQMQIARPEVGRLNSRPSLPNMHMGQQQQSSVPPPPPRPTVQSQTQTQTQTQTQSQTQTQTEHLNMEAPETPPPAYEEFRPTPPALPPRPATSGPSMASQHSVPFPHDMPPPPLSSHTHHSASTSSSSHSPSLLAPPHSTTSFPSGSGSSSTMTTLHNQHQHQFPFGYQPVIIPKLRETVIGGRILNTPVMKKLGNRAADLIEAKVTPVFGAGVGGGGHGNGEGAYPGRREGKR